MEAEKAEASRRYNNPFQNIRSYVELAGVVALGYCCLPAIVNLLHVVVPLWFDWFTLVLRNLFFVFVVVNVIIFLIYITFSKTKTTEKKEPEIYDQYVAALPSPPTVTPFDYYDILKVGDFGYEHTSSYREIVPEFQAVKAVEESSCTYGQEVVEMSSKSYRRTRSEKKKTERMVEFRRTESERVTKTGSWRSQSIDGLSSEEFRMTVETFISEKKKMLIRDSGVVDQWQNGYVHFSEHGYVPQWQNGGVPQLQNGSVPQWQNGCVPQWQTGGVPQWQTGGVPQLQNGGVPQLQNGAVNQWQCVPEPQNGVVQWQGSRDDGSGRHGHRHGHRSRRHRLEGGSGSKGSGSYLAISN
ncbi:unnamed protein product [Arabidopsis arenosa]|uniref:Uncharacterized protein n=1 Tax=Arabidopsis arenosa TaxID=38785 RepID=A0A8S1ZND9_ARAAE|nr:unnamed protein product [Arabidopsis arenosa]